LCVLSFFVGRYVVVCCFLLCVFVLSCCAFCVLILMCFLFFF